MTIVTCTATDVAGKTNACTFTVTINDTQAPSITCPANLSTNLTAGCTTTVTYTNAAATDNCPGVTFVCSPANGSVFSLGVTTVSCNATDAVGLTASCSFTVTVTAAAPTISVQPANQSTPMGNGATFSVTAAGTSTLTYQWRTNGVNVTGATASSFSISNLTLAANGLQVSVGVTNCAGGLLSSAATLTVTPISGISFDFNTPGQYTNAPYNLFNNDWGNNNLVNQQPFGPVIPWESATGGVGVAQGGPGLDLMFNNGTVQSSTFHTLPFDFSLPGKRLTASVMFKSKTVLANNRAIQLGFTSQTNADLDGTAGRNH